MQTEFEVKFLCINIVRIRHRLKSAGAELVSPERVMRRCNFESSLVNKERLGQSSGRGKQHYDEL